MIGKEMIIKDFTTEELIKELNSRNLFDELDDKKSKWLKDNGYIQIEHQFINLEEAQYPSKFNSLFSLEYLKNKNIDEIKRKAAYYL